MVETSDALEPLETEPSRPARSAGQKDSDGLAASSGSAPSGSTAAQPRTAPPTQGTGEREEVRVDDRLELASQQSTETGSLDGSCRGPLNSSITSTTSTLVPGMLEEAEEEEEEEEDYTSKTISVEPTHSSRIESWVSKTLENLQLGKSQDSTEEEEEEEEEEDDDDDDDDRGQSDVEEDLDSADVTEASMSSIKKVEAKLPGWRSHMYSFALLHSSFTCLHSSFPVTPDNHT